jgi:nicotinate-nucleotide adenylyltransferase
MRVNYRSATEASNRIMSNNPLSSPARFLKGVALRSGRVGIFPGAFNPVTRAHLALAQAARDQHSLDQVVFLLPRVFPHKGFEGASFEERVSMLESALAGDAAFAISTGEGGLVIELVQSLRAACGEKVEIFVLCGRDAAERFAGWDYGGLPAFSEQLELFQVLVGSREGEYNIPPEYAGRIRLVRMPPGYDEHSSSAVREAMDAGQPWEHLIPESVARHIQANNLYGTGHRST